MAEAEGVSPLEALKTYTLNGAYAASQQAEKGSIEVGKQADIVAIGGNPLADITAVSDMDTVIKAGRVYHVEELMNELRTAFADR